MSNYYCPSIIDNGHRINHVCRGGAFILPLEKGYECLCGATYEHYMCRCTEGCGLENQIDVKGNLIKSNK